MKRKQTALARELFEQRMIDEGFDTLDHKVHMKQLSASQIAGMPEFTITEICRRIVEGNRKGTPTHTIIAQIEEHRRKIGENRDQYQICIREGRAAEDELKFITFYCYYRVKIEHSGVMDIMQVRSAAQRSILFFAR